MTLDIHPLRPKELGQVELDMPFHPHEQWLDWLRRQSNGDIILFVAWLDGAAVGHVMVAWKPRGDPWVEWAGCPWIYDALTHPDHRSRGVGTAMIQACEQAAWAHGARTLGIGVSVTNVRARALYERLGYRDPGIGARMTTGQWTSPDGVLRMWEDHVQYLTKSLRPTA